MSTQDCLAALNACLDTQTAPYDGNRKFKRISKTKNAQGQVVRQFRDDTYTFTMTGDGPFHFGLELPAGAPVPAWAVSHVQAPTEPVVRGYFQEDDGQFTLVLKEFWDAHQGIDADAADALSAVLPPEFSNLADATFEYDGDIEDATYALRKAGFVRTSFDGTGMGAGWLFSLGGKDSTLVDDHDNIRIKSGFYLVRKAYYEREGCFQSIHVAPEFPDFPAQFTETMEAAFLSEWDEPTTRAWLLAQGFETNADLDAMGQE